ncbi:interferon gamma receptor 2 [Nematolebias whitei]|uniref:interferon gamma receptor 2 n=1 Tax=Nematolebias whitei TaxID=451745 RepID=UPI00189ACC01|nr:interferon gamma receptor 2 [Nematolebias whitei]
MFSGSRRCFLDFFVVVLSVCALGPVDCDGVLAPPTHVHVNGSRLVWTAASEESGVTYRVEYQRFASNSWDVVPECRSTPLTFCDRGPVRSQNWSHDACVQLRVQAERAGSMSEPVQACSTHGDPCSPQVHLTARPGSLTVHLSKNHSLFLEHADHARHWIYFGAEGEELEEHDSYFSKRFSDLLVGRRYCTKVQFVLYHKPIGPASCVQCETIPQSGESAQTGLITAVVVVVLALLAVWLCYILICRYKKIKEFLRPPCSIPQFFQDPVLDRGVPFVALTPTEENFDVVSSLTPTGSRGDQNLLLLDTEQHQKVSTRTGSDRVFN